MAFAKASCCSASPGLPGTSGEAGLRAEVRHHLRNKSERVRENHKHADQAQAPGVRAERAEMSALLYAAVAASGAREKEKTPDARIHAADLGVDGCESDCTYLLTY